MSSMPATSCPRPELSVPRFLIVQGEGQGRVIPLANFPFMVGRGVHCDLQLRDLQVSRVHCVVKYDQGLLTVQDVGSRNGTMVNSRKVMHCAALAPGDLLVVGQTALQVQPAESPMSPAVSGVTQVGGETLGRPGAGSAGGRPGP